MLLQRTITALVLGIVVPSAIFIIILIGYCLYRRIRPSSYHGYDQVDDELDEEEIEFTRRIQEVEESSHGNSQEKEQEEAYEQNYSKYSFLNVDNTSNGELDSDNDIEDVEFDATDHDRLQIIEKLRTNLIKGADISYLSEHSNSDKEM